LLLYLNPQITQKMKKQPKVTTATKFFMAMRITECLEQAADAISETHEQLLWHHVHGNIVVDFATRTINVLGDEHHPFIISHLLEICEHYYFALNINTCDCPNCKALKQQYN
jgi:hypothetical protein